MQGIAGPSGVPVGAALAVNRTRDGGRSLQTLRHRLPEQECRDLVYRHALAFAVDRRRLLGAEPSATCGAATMRVNTGRPC